MKANPGQIPPRDSRIPGKSKAGRGSGPFSAGRPAILVLAAVWAALLPLCPALAAPADPADLSGYQYEETRNLVALVEEAAQLFHEKGSAAFPEFRTKGSRWFRNSRYLFVYDLDGTCVFHPIDEELVGKPLLNIEDIHGKPVIRMIVGAANSEPFHCGWLHYLWVEPGEIFPSWKTTYIRRVTGPDGKSYAIGSGLYNMKPEKTFVTGIVDSAAELIKQKGEDAFADLKDPASPYVYRDTYVFVLRMDGTALVDPGYPCIQGRNLKNFTDFEGRHVFREMIEKLQKEPQAWVMYMQVLPGGSTPVRKLAYVRRVRAGGLDLIVGSAYALANPIWLRW
ncbi:MAG: cache domain-containing protein [Thermodesulfobacteriota bacterium]